MRCFAASMAFATWWVGVQGSCRVSTCLACYCAWVVFDCLKQMGRDWWETPHMEPSERGFSARGSWINMNQLELHHARVNLSWNPLRCCWKTYLTWAVIPLLLALSLVVNSFPQARYYMTRGGQNAMLTEEGFKHTAAWRDSGEVMKFVSRLLKDDMKATLKLGREVPNIYPRMHPFFLGSLMIIYIYICFFSCYVFFGFLISLSPSIFWHDILFLES